MFAKEKIHKAIKNLNNALHNIENGDTDLAIGDLNHSRENAEEAIWLLLSDKEINNEM